MSVIVSFKSPEEDIKSETRVERTIILNDKSLRTNFEVICELIHIYIYVYIYTTNLITL